MTDTDLLLDASHRASRYIESLEDRRVFPSEEALANLTKLGGPMPQEGIDSSAILEQLDTIGSPATVVSAGPNYYGFVIGSTLPVADAAERLSLAWDQCASGEINSPIAHAIERVAGAWITKVLDLPEESVVGFGTSATACGLSCIATARRTLLSKLGWDIEQQGLNGAPEIHVLVSQKVHVTILKALRILGFGLRQITFVKCDSHGRIDPDALPIMNERTILCLQAGEVNTGEFDPFQLIIPKAKEKGAWVHIDGAFGLWARASTSYRHLTEGAELADSWTTDGHKWLNTPYDGAMAICRHAGAIADTLNADAVYSKSGATAQKNLTLEFSRRARGIPIWAALKHLGREGVASMVEKHCVLAKRIADGLHDSGYRVINRVVLNQVLVRCDSDTKTEAAMEAAQKTGQIWFGPSVWEDRPAFRISLCSWRTNESHVEKLISLMEAIAKELDVKRIE